MAENIFQPLSNKYFPDLIGQLFDSRGYLLGFVCQAFEKCAKDKNTNMEFNAKHKRQIQINSIFWRKNPMRNQSISTCEKVRLSHAAYMCVFRRKAKLAFHKYPDAHYVAPWLRSNDVPCAIRNFILWMEKKGKLCHSATKTKYHVHLCNCANVQLCMYCIQTYGIFPSSPGVTLSYSQLGTILIWRNWKRIILPPEKGIWLNSKCETVWFWFA